MTTIPELSFTIFMIYTAGFFVTFFRKTTEDVVIILTADSAARYTFFIGANKKVGRTRVTNSIIPVSYTSLLQ